ncbi:OLC1v1035978C1 [Oldenlandia corymbosa var. corymbosa]|uniref:OLC1v1035978C1 n=1 Tax=Oldenlandia corymbosa var. corymbosa TaxID=529605 RepID=A0AAV1CXD8_OLDCO|nr:OLC1v1035978C1 [Oldenlandia corymbosa var. corymbosa]
MESQTSPLFSAADSPPPQKLRLMCSYGGIFIRRQQGTLCYAGGETRLVSVDRHSTAASLSAFTGHLSKTLLDNRPFQLKYQLPGDDLDTLVSVTTDEDLENMLQEHECFSAPAIASLSYSRIRLFLFPVQPMEPVWGYVLVYPNADSWFSDALNCAGIVQTGQPVDPGLEVPALDNIVRSDDDGIVASEAQI